MREMRKQSQSIKKINELRLFKESQSGIVLNFKGRQKQNKTKQNKSEGVMHKKRALLRVFPISDWNRLLYINRVFHNTVPC